MPFGWRTFSAEIEQGQRVTEYHPVSTIGLRTKHYTLNDEHRLQQLGAEFYRTNRGGLIIFHDTSQLAAYPQNSKICGPAWSGLSVQWSAVLLRCAPNMDSALRQPWKPKFGWTTTSSRQSVCENTRVGPKLQHWSDLIRKCCANRPPQLILSPAIDWNCSWTVLQADLLRQIGIAVWKVSKLILSQAQQCTAHLNVFSFQPFSWKGSLMRYLSTWTVHRVNQQKSDSVDTRRFKCPLIVPVLSETWTFKIWTNKTSLHSVLIYVCAGI